jgi:hypothetical protein
MPRQPHYMSAGAALLLVTGCNGACWLPSLTFGLSGVNDRRGRDEQERTGAAFRLRADARLGWSLDVTPARNPAGASDPARASTWPRVSRNDSGNGNRRCRSRALCAWEALERARALGGTQED